MENLDAMLFRIHLLISDKTNLYILGNKQLENWVASLEQNDQFNWCTLERPKATFSWRYFLQEKRLNEASDLFKKAFVNKMFVSKTF